MSVSPDYKEWVLEQLRRVGAVTAKSMFGGVGLYRDGLFFALLADDTLYFKVDDSNRGAFEAAGMEAFRPYGPDSLQVMQYYQVPAEVLEDPDELRMWAEGAVEVARRKKKR